jgi:hypothetical protein
MVCKTTPSTQNKVIKNSSHPNHIKINIPFNLASRIITITNTEELRYTRLRELRLYLKNQQYPEEIVEHGIQKALEKGPMHTELREQVHVTSNQNNIIPFVTTYNARDYNIFHFTKQIEYNLNSSERMKNVLQKKEDYKHMFNYFLRILLIFQIQSKFS